MTVTPTRRRSASNPAAHAEIEIPSYWILDPDPDAPSLAVHTLRADGSEPAYARTHLVSGAESVTLAEPFPITLCPADLVWAPATEPTEDPAPDDA